MSILVTGGAGYVGMNVVEALAARRERVVLIDNGEPPAAVRRALESLHEWVELVHADIGDEAAIARAFEGRAVTGVVHCAAMTAGPAREKRDPAASVDVNLHGTLNVLAAARAHAVKRVVYTSSAAIYGESLYRLARIYEDSAPVLPVSVYGITKFAAERLCVRMRELWELDIVCARLGTLVGPWERDTGVRDNFGTHSQLARMALNGERAVLPPHFVRRDWVYSRDVAAGLVGLLTAQAPRHAVYNLSSGEDWGNVLSWCAALKESFPRFDYAVAHEGEMPNVHYTDRDRFPLDIGRISQDIGFRPQFPPAAAFVDFLAWLRSTPDLWERA